jgi:hypothetical protein
MAQTEPTTHDERHRSLVRRLTADIKPARTLWPVRARVGLWMALEAVIITLIIVREPGSITTRISQPIYAPEILLFIAAALIFALMALRSALPGRVLGALDAMIAGILALAGTVLVMVGEPATTSQQLREFMRVGLSCACMTGALAIVPWIVLWWMVGRGAPMRGSISGVLVGAGALSFSFAMMRIVCPLDDPLHLLIWHLLPALVLIALSGLAGAVWLRFRPRLAWADHAA